MNPAVKSHIFDRKSNEKALFNLEERSAASKPGKRGKRGYVVIIEKGVTIFISKKIERNEKKYFFLFSLTSLR